ncbi:MAG: hypothetical protein ACOX2F_12800 [bacterium]
MRNILIILFSLFTFISCASCNNSSQNHDSDTVLHDSDLVTVRDSDMQDTENNETGPDMTDSEIPDADDNTYCPSLKEAPFPYTDKTGQKHFCRPCDTPAENDPHCVINLMQDLHNRVGSSDCWPYPCKWDAIKPMKQGDSGDPDYLHECDLKVSVNGGAWSIKGVGRKQFVLKDGIVQLGLSGSIGSYYAGRWVKYHIKERYYEVVVSPVESCQGSYSNKLTTVLFYEYSPSWIEKGTYLIAIEDKEDIPYYRVIFTAKNNLLTLPTQPVIGPEHVAVNADFYSDNPEEDMLPAEVLVAKRGEWKWKKIAEGEADLDMSGNYLAVHVNPLEQKDSYLCNLTKEINSITTDCKKINRDGEDGNYVVFDDLNSKRLVYTSDLKKLTIREEKDGKVTYTDLYIPPVKAGDEYDRLLSAEQLKGNILLYGETRDMIQGIWTKRQVCQINIETKERVCIPFGINDWAENPRQGDSMWEGDYVAWQTSGSTILTLRDMKCYCEKEGVCLLKEY